MDDGNSIRPGTALGSCHGGAGNSGKGRLFATARDGGAAGPWGLVSLCLALCLTLGLAACGTNIKGLLAKEADGAWENESLTEKAVLVAPEALVEVRDAEDAKFAQCRQIDEAVQERLDRGHIGFWEQLLSDLKLLGALLVPVPFVERCADAHEDYDEAILRLRESLAADGGAD